VPRPTGAAPSSAAAATARTRSLADYALLGLLALLWGISYNLAKIAVQTIPPVTMTAMRFVIGFAVLAAILRLRGMALLSRRHPWSRLGVQSTINNVLPWTMTAWAALTIDSGLVTILNSTSPIFAFLVTWGVTRHEPATPARLVGALTGLAGVVTIVGLGVLSGGASHLLQQTACIAGAILFGIAAVHGKRLDGTPPLLVATLTLLIGAVVTVPACLLVDRPWTLAPSTASIVALLGLGIFSTAAAVVVYYRILATLGSIAAASQSYLRILVGVSIGILFLGESLAANQALGMILILIGVIAMTRPERSATRA
jgi:drug/metabolite transporter (DMT)-like permease